MHPLLIILFALTVVLLFISMVLTAVSASDIKKSPCSSDPKAQQAYKFSMINAIVMGLIVAVVALTMILYIVYSNRDTVAALAVKAGRATSAAYSSFASPDEMTKTF